MYDRGDSDGALVTAEFDDCISWIAHPNEGGRRASHAITTERGVWLIDPIDAPNVDERIEALGNVVGILVCSCWHARDAGVFAQRYDVSVHIPEWMDRIERRVDAPIDRYTLTPDPEVHLFSCRPFPGWQEVFLYHEPTATLVSPDSLGTIDSFLIDDERLGLVTLRRLQPPRQLSGLQPARILVGHGEPLTQDATAALSDALDRPRRTFPRALVENGAENLRGGLGAVVD